MKSKKSVLTGRSILFVMILALLLVFASPLAVFADEGEKGAGCEDPVVVENEEDEDKQKGNKESAAEREQRIEQQKALEREQEQAQEQEKEWVMLKNGLEAEKDALECEKDQLELQKEALENQYQAAEALYEQTGDPQYLEQMTQLKAQINDIKQQMDELKAQMRVKIENMHQVMKANFTAEEWEAYQNAEATCTSLNALISQFEAMEELLGELSEEDMETYQEVLAKMEWFKSLMERVL